LPITLRWVALAALLACELAWLTVWFSFDRVRIQPALLWVGSAAPDLLRVAIGFAAAFVLVTSEDAGTFLHALRNQRAGRWIRWLLIHAMAIGALGVSFHHALSPPSGPGITVQWVLAWSALAAFALLGWIFAFAPARSWRRALRTKRFAVLISALVGVCVWIAGVLAQSMWRPLAAGTLLGTHWLLHKIYPDMRYDSESSVLGTDRLLVEIAKECSGYEGIALIVGFVGIYLWLFRRELRFPRALLLLPIGMAAIWLLNIVRIAALIVIGTELSPEIAVGGFHSQAGWITFTLIALGLIWISHRLGLAAVPAEADRVRDANPDARASEPGNPAAPLLVPLLALLASGMMGAAFTQSVNALYPLGVAVTGAVLWHYRSRYHLLTPRVSWMAPATGAIVFALWWMLEPQSQASGAALTQALGQWPGWLAGAWVVFRLAGSVVTVPLAEELAFRGYLMRRLIDFDFERVPIGAFTWFSFAVSSLLFGLLHQRLLAGTLAAAVYALLLYRTRRVSDVVFAHATTNALIGFAVVVHGHWGLWT